MRFIDRDEIARRLSYDLCIKVVREAMIAFSNGQTKQTLRTIIPLSEGRVFGIMPGAMGEQGVFGAKIVAVFKGRGHQGLVLLFDPETGAPVCTLEAGEITRIRTAAASAVATDVLARKEAATLAIYGTGEQAAAHAHAIGKVRALEQITIWGRSFEKAKTLARDLQAQTGLWVEAVESAEQAAAADIICTTTSAPEPILHGAWLKPGAHVNIVGSSYAGPAEVDNELVQRTRFIADSREGVLAQGAEFLRAKAAGVVDDAHVAGEIGQVLSGKLDGRRNAEEITAYKSLGHVVQDLASAWAVYSQS